MEGTQQRESRRGHESRPRGGRNGGARSERSPRENKPEKKQENEKPQEFVKRPRLQHITLRRAEKDIKLNEEQQKQVFELDQKIGAYGKVELPAMEEREKKNKEFEMETEKLQSQLQTKREKVDEITKKIDDFNKKHDPHKKEHDEIRAEIKKIDEVLQPTNEKLRSLRETKISASTKLRDIKEKTPGRSIEDIDAKIDELEYQIETSTLSNTQLKSKLSQIEQLKKNRGQFGNVAQLQNSIIHVKEEEKKLNASKKELQEKRDELYKQINSFNQGNSSFKEQIDKFWDEKKKVFGEIKELKEQINKKYAEKKEYNDQFFKNLNELRGKRNEVAVLINSRLKIFQEAERHMDLLEKGANKAGEIKERKNPNEGKISAAKSLIGFLQGQLALREDYQPKEKVEKTVVETEASKIINSIRKPSKKERKNQKRQEKPKDEKPKVKKMNFTVDSLQQFSLVGITQPSSQEEIPKVIAELKKKVDEWQQSFIKVTLNFDVQEDGSIKSSIKLE